MSYIYEDVSFAAKKEILAAQTAMTGGPLNIIDLCARCGITAQLDQTLPEEIAGRILRTPQHKYEIYYGFHDSQARRRFTIAHLFAHCLLHAEQLPDSYSENILLRGGLSNSAEANATLLAREILIPRELLDRDIAKNIKMFPPWEVAHRFGVTPQLMSIHLGIPLDW